jgi:hypothetical protein
VNGIFSQFGHKGFIFGRKWALRGETPSHLCPSLPLHSLLILSFSFTFDA